MLLKNIGFLLFEQKRVEFLQIFFNNKIEKLLDLDYICDNKNKSNDRNKNNNNAF